MSGDAPTDGVDKVRAFLLSRRGESLTLEARRARFEAQWAAAEPPPEVRFESEDLRPGLSGLWARGPDAAPERAIVWLHGGAFALGSSASLRQMCARIAVASGVDVFTLDYALAPEHPFPTALDQTIEALSILAGRGLSGGRLLVGGDSAGANLALAAVQTQVAAGPTAPAGLWLISPYLDLTHSGASVKTRADRDPFVDVASMPGTAGGYLQGADPTDPRASPLFGPMGGLPPTLIQVGEDEALFDDARRLARAIEDAGGTAMFQEWAGMIHAFPMFADTIPEGLQALAQGARFARTRLVQA